MQTKTKNGQGSHWGLLPYGNNGESELDETNTSAVKIFTKL